MILLRSATVFVPGTDASRARAAKRRERNSPDSFFPDGQRTAGGHVNAGIAGNAIGDEVGSVEDDCGVAQTFYSRAGRIRDCRAIERDRRPGGNCDSVRYCAGDGISVIVLRRSIAYTCGTESEQRGGYRGTDCLCFHVCFLSFLC